MNRFQNAIRKVPIGMHSPQPSEQRQRRPTLERFQAAQRRAFERRQQEMHAELDQLKVGQAQHQAPVKRRGIGFWWGNLLAAVIGGAAVPVAYSLITTYGMPILDSI